MRISDDRYEDAGDVSGPEFQTIFNMVVTGAALLAAWVLNTVWAAVKALQEDDKKIADSLAEIKVLVAGDYVKKTEYRSDLADIKEMLGKIHDKLDSKVDKR